MDEDQLGLYNKRLDLLHSKVRDFPQLNIAPTINCQLSIVNRAHGLFAHTIVIITVLLTREHPRGLQCREMRSAIQRMLESLPNNVTGEFSSFATVLSRDS